MEKIKLDGATAVIRAGGYIRKRHTPMRASAALLAAGASVTPAASFEVDFGPGFTDPAKEAFAAAVQVWSVSVASPVKIRIKASWEPLGAGVLGSAGPADFARDFQNAPQAQTWYPSALAAKLQGQASEAEVHIEASFNSTFSNWYFGLDGDTPIDKYDLMSVILHEIGHGLGFVGSMRVQGGKGRWGANTPFPFIWDRFVKNSLGQSLLDQQQFPQDSSILGGELQSNQLFFTGTNAAIQNGGTHVRLFAPMIWQQGSSYSHLDEVTFPSGNTNALMTPQIGLGESVHDPGELGLAILNDIGW